MNSIRIAILGAGGQVGSNLLKYLSGEPGLDVWGICRNEVTAGPLRMAGFNTRVGSVTDAEGRPSLFGECDVVVNCAAAGGLPAQARREDEAILHAILALPPHVRLIHFSSVAVYGTCISADRNTFAKPRPDWQYGKHKLHLEGLLKRSAGSRPVVILRMGHVYGAGQWLSKFALQSAQSSDLRLPFDGRLPTNAVHVRNVATAIRTLVTEGPQSGTYNLFDPGQTTWRQLFDWNTEAMGWLPVGSQPEPESQQARAYYRRIASTAMVPGLVKETFGWAKALPGSFIAASPTIKKAGLMLLAKTKSEKLESRVLQVYQGSTAGGAGGSSNPLPPYLYADGAPGPTVSYHSELTSEDQTSVASWYRRLASPNAIIEWDCEVAPAGMAQGADA